MNQTTITWTPEQIGILAKQVFSGTEPGTLLQDFDTLLEFIGKTGTAVSEKTQLFAINTLPEINRVLTHSLDVKLKRPVQKSFPHINGLYLLLRSSGLSYIVPDGKKTKLMLHEDVLADWKTLEPAERYFSLLQVFCYRASEEMIGGRQSFLAPTCFYECLSFFRRELDHKIDLIAERYDPEGLRYHPGLHNLALMELFGFIKVERGPASEKETWPVAAIEATAWGRAVLGYLTQYFAAMPFLEDDELVQAEPEAWESEFKKYIPDWKRSLVQIERNITETGSYLFNVSLGNASCKMAVPAGISLDELAYGILEAFDFDSDHLYEFVYKNEYGVEESIAHPYADSDHEYCTADCPVGYLPLYKGMIFIFHFDFGDNWEFKIQVGAMPPTEPDYSELTIIEKRGTPPEQYADWEGGYEDDD